MAKLQRAGEVSRHAAPATDASLSARAPAELIPRAGSPAPALGRDRMRSRRRCGVSASAWARPFQILRHPRGRRAFLAFRGAQGAPTTPRARRITSLLHGDCLQPQDLDPPRSPSAQQWGGSCQLTSTRGHIMAWHGSAGRPNQRDVGNRSARHPHRHRERGVCFPLPRRPLSR